MELVNLLIRSLVNLYMNTSSYLGSRIEVPILEILEQERENEKHKCHQVTSNIV